MSFSQQKENIDTDQTPSAEQILNFVDPLSQIFTSNATPNEFLQQSQQLQSIIQQLDDIDEVFDQILEQEDISGLNSSENNDNQHSNYIAYLQHESDLQDEQWLTLQKYVLAVEKKRT